MKKFAAVFFIIGALGIAAFAMLGLGSGQAETAQDFLRLHIRANSDDPRDQDIKYTVKQQIVNELTPLFVDVTTKMEAMQRLESKLGFIESIANRVLAENGFIYTARAAIKTELFPTRTYNDVTLPEGIYDALIVNLGTGEGANWWCVVYPPLCFLENNIGGDTGVKYRSKLQEIIKRYF